MSFESTVKSAVREAVLDVVKAKPFHKENVSAIYVTGTARVQTPGAELLDLVTGTSKTKVTGAEAAANTWITSKTSDGKSAVLSASLSGSSVWTVNLDAAVTAGDTSITVGALTSDIPAGTKLTFVDTTAKIVVTSAIALAGATTVSIYPAQVAITDNTNALLDNGVLNFYPVVGTGDGSTRLMTTTLTLPANYAIQPKTFEMFDADTWATAVEQVTDDGNGILTGVIRATGAAGGTGTINYATGAISYTWATAVVNGTEVLAKFYYGKFGKCGISDQNNDMFHKYDIIINYQEMYDETNFTFVGKIMKHAKDVIAEF